MKNIIVAYSAAEMAIGRNNTLPWEGKLPADMKHFKELTIDKSVIMGRSTFESLPEAYRPLPRRQNIVLSLSQRAIEGVQVVRSLDEAYELAAFEPFVIGGAKVYEQALPTVDRVYATEVLAHIPDADAHFTSFPSPEWRIDGKPEFHIADERNAYSYAFVTYLRKSPIEQ